MTSIIGGYDTGLFDSSLFLLTRNDRTGQGTAGHGEQLYVNVANGNLAGRLDKDFECFVPDKEAESEAHPVIIAAKCSVQNNNSPYVGRYIVERIKAIPVADIEESRENGYPTVLVIGPDPFRSAAYNVIREAFPDAVHRKSEVVPVDALEGYFVRHR